MEFDETAAKLAAIHTLVNLAVVSIGFLAVTSLGAVPGLVMSVLLVVLIPAAIQYILLEKRVNQ